MPDKVTAAGGSPRPRHTYESLSSHSRGELQDIAIEAGRADLVGKGKEDLITGLLEAK